MPAPTRPASSTTMRSGPKSSCCPTCTGIRTSPSWSRPTTAASPATSSAPPTRARSSSGSTTMVARRGARWPRPDVERTRQDGTLIYAYSRRRGAEPYGDAYPAHLHIDLLPELQGQGWGRRLIEILIERLRERGVPGLHLAASTDNAGALAFYPRVGFTPAALPSGRAGVRAGSFRQRPRPSQPGVAWRGWDDLTAPTGREEALRAPPRTDGTAPLALVLGATGYLGGRLVPRLLNGGYRVRVLARDARRVAAFDWGGRVEVVEGDATDRAPSATRSATSTSSTTSCIRWVPARGSRDADRAAATTVAEAAAAASVGRIVYLGGLHPEDAELSPHLRSRVEVGQILLDSGRAHAGAAGRRRDRIGLRVVRDGAPPHRGAAVHARTEMGAQPDPADRRARCAALPAGRGARRLRREPCGRHRRARRAALRADDERVRGGSGPEAARDRRAAGAHPAPRVALGEPRDADPAAGGDAARRVAAERVRREEPRRRRADPAAGGGTHFLPAGRRSRAGQGQARRDRDQLAGRRGARSAERPAAQRPGLGGQDRLHRSAERRPPRHRRRRSGV